MAKRFKITVDGVVHDVVVEESGEVSSVASSAVTTSSVSASGKTINAPLQGTLQSFKVKVGDRVKSGDVTCIIEAMKMENDVPSIYDGVVKALLVTEGQKVESNQPLIEIG